MPDKKLPQKGRDIPLSATPQPTPIKDSSRYYNNLANKAAYEMQAAISAPANRIASGKIIQANKDAARQKLKGKPGYDRMGFPIKKP